MAAGWGCCYGFKLLCFYISKIKFIDFSKNILVENEFKFTCSQIFEDIKIHNHSHYSYIYLVFFQEKNERYIQHIGLISLTLLYVIHGCDKRTANRKQKQNYQLFHYFSFYSYLS